MPNPATLAPPDKTDEHGVDGPNDGANMVGTLRRVVVVAGFSVLKVIACEGFASVCTDAPEVELLPAVEVWAKTVGENKISRSSVRITSRSKLGHHCDPGELQGLRSTRRT